MARPITVTAAPLAAAVATGVCQSQVPGTGALNMNGALVVNGVAVFDQARQLAFVSTGSNVASTFTITGTDAFGAAQSEALVGGNNSTVVSTKNYKTVTSITSSAPSAGSLTVGTNNSPAITSSQWVRFDDYGDAGVAIQINAVGTTNITVQQTLDDPNSPTNPVAPANVTWMPHPDATLVAAALVGPAGLQGNYAYKPTFARLLLNSGTGTATATFMQAGGGDY
jgi:hypothetical protein